MSSKNTAWSPAAKAGVAALVALVACGILIGVLAATGKLGSKKTTGVSACDSDAQCAQKIDCSGKGWLANHPTCVGGGCACRQSTTVSVVWGVAAFVACILIVVVAQMAWKSKSKRVKSRR
jgi:hypothetical protein